MRPQVPATFEIPASAALAFVVIEELVGSATRSEGNVTTFGEAAFEARKEMVLTVQPDAAASLEQHGSGEPAVLRLSIDYTRRKMAGAFDDEYHSEQNTAMEQSPSENGLAAGPSIGY